MNKYEVIATIAETFDALYESDSFFDGYDTETMSYLMDRLCFVFDVKIDPLYNTYSEIRDFCLKQTQENSDA